MPAVLPEPGVKVALFPAGRPERSAVSAVMGSPSGSTAVTPTLTGWFSATATLDGAVVTGASSAKLPRVNESRIPPSVQVTSFLFAPLSPAGPQIITPLMPVAEKRSRRAPWCRAR